MSLTKSTYSMIKGAPANVLDFGADPTGVADSYSAIMDAINSVTYGTGYYVSGPAVYFPPGTYRCDTTIQLKKSIRLFGDGSGLPTSSTAAIQFPAGVTGIIIHRYNTIDATTESPPTTAGDASIISGLRLLGTAGTPDSYGGHGIWLRARAVIENVYINAFAGNGINIVASSGSSSPSMEGNANNFMVSTVRVQNCGGHGLYTDGADVNAGEVTSVDCSRNSGWGIYDSSFLGNTYTACHTASNTLGAYKLDSANARNVLVGCYSESGQPASEVVQPSIIIGGLHSAGFSSSSTAPYLLGTMNGVTSNKGVTSSMTGTTNTNISAIGGNPDNGDILRFSSPEVASNVYRLKFSGKDILFSYANANTRSPFRITGDETTYVFGRSAAVPDAFNTNKLWIGNGNNSRYLSAASAAPTSGEYARGDIVFNISPSAGGKVGWVCVTAGSPGTWKEFGAIDA